MVDPISTAWYKENIKKSEPTITTTTINKDRILTGTDIVSSKIRDSLSSNGTVRGLSHKFSQYTPSTSSGKIDLYSPVNTTEKIDSRRFPSRTNDLTTGPSKYPASNYMSTYASTYGSSKNYFGGSFNATNTHRRDPIARDYPNPRKESPLVNGSTLATSTLKKELTAIEPVPSAQLALPTRSQSSTSPGRFNSMSNSISAPKAASFQSDEFYMRQISQILDVHSAVLFNASPAQVTDYMYIGGYKDAENWQNLRRLGITHVLNMAAMRKTCVNPYPPQSGVVGYEAFDADDHEMYNVMQHYPRAKAFIDRARWSGGKVLVHCAMGVNRSGAMCCAYLMTEQKMGLLDAMRQLKRARGTVLCNRGFQKQLLRLAKQKGSI